MSRLAAQRLLLATVICLFVTGQLLGFFSRFSALIEGYAAVPLLAIVAYRPDVWGLRWLDLKPLRLLGLASGSFYVLHMSVFVWIMEFLRPAIPQHLSFLYPALVGPAVIIACLTLFAPIAVLSYYLVEAPAIAFGRQLIKRRRYAPAEPATGE
jgi:peptidoglycan/LPS O-acetylase OafA/YrhL